jgi:hypothetical protein
LDAPDARSHPPRGKGLHDESDEPKGHDVGVVRAHATSHRERGDITMAKKAAKGAKKKGGKKR